MSEQLRFTSLTILLSLFVILGVALNCDANPYYGKYRGVVTNVNDPEGRGRITAIVPDVFGSSSSGWAMPSVPFAHDNGYGLILLPEVGDGVWVEFEQGNSSYPIWSGSFWGNGGYINNAQIRRLVTPSGLQIILNDSARTLQLIHPGGAGITLSDTGITAVIGSTSLIIGTDGVIIQ